MRTSSNVDQQPTNLPAGITVVSLIL